MLAVLLAIVSHALCTMDHLLSLHRYSSKFNFHKIERLKLKHTLVNMLQVFVEIHGRRIGYPILNDYGTVCQTPPFTYSQLALGALQEISGTLRGNGGNVVGVWDKGCFRRVQLNNSTCDYPFSSRVSECDNDSRMQMNSVSEGIVQLEKYRELREASRSILPILERIEELQTLVSFQPRELVLTQLSMEVLSARMQAKYIQKMVADYILGDIPAIMSSNTKEAYRVAYQHLSAMMNELQTSIEESTSQKEFENYCSALTNINDLLCGNYSSSLLALHENADSVVGEARLFSKNLALSLHLLTTKYTLYILDEYDRIVYNCLNNNCTLLEQVSYPAVTYESVFKSIFEVDFSGIDACMYKVMSKLYDPKLLVDEDALNWHECLLVKESKRRQIMTVDFSKRYSTNSIESNEGLSGSVFNLHLLFPRFVRVNGQLTMPMDVANILKEGNLLVDPLVEYEEPSAFRVMNYASNNPKSSIPLDNSGFMCTPGRYGKNCEVCPVGTYSPGGFLHICSNAPEGAEYIARGWMNSECPFKCPDGLYRSGSHCTTPPAGQYPRNGTEVVGECQTSFDRSFVRFMSSGKTSMPYSCGLTLDHVMRMNVNLTSFLTGSFTVDLWMKLDLEEMSKQMGVNTVFGFGILEVIDSWSWYLRVNSSSNTAQLELSTHASEIPITSSTMALDEEWHHYSIIYDARLRLVSFILDSTLIGTAWYSYALKAVAEHLIVGGRNFANNRNNLLPPVFGIVPGSLALVQLHNDAFPLEFLSSTLQRISTGCTDGYTWNGYKCIPICDKGAVADANQSCLCHWGKYLDSATSKCEWCDHISTLGSSYPYMLKSNCLCADGYVWVDNINSCVIAKPPLMMPNVTFKFPPLPESRSAMSSSETGFVYPIGTVMTISLPTTWNQASSRRRLALDISDESIVTTLSIQSGTEDVLDNRVSVSELPMSYTFNMTGQYKVVVFFSKSGHMSGTQFSSLITAQQRAKTPSCSPNVTELTGAAILIASSTERTKHQIMFRIGSQGERIYDSENPPIIIPPVTIRLYTLSLDSSVLPSEELIVQYTWDRSSPGYAKYMQDLNAIPATRNTTDVIPSGVALTSWCNRNIPNCIMAIVIPIVAVIVLLMICIIIAIILKVIIKKRKRRLRKERHNASEDANVASYIPLKPKSQQRRSRQSKSKPQPPKRRTKSQRSRTY